MRKSLLTVLGAAMLMAGTSSLAFAQSAYAPPDPATGAAAGAAVGGAVGTATGAAAGTAAGTANMAAGAPVAATPAPVAASGSSTPPAAGKGVCPAGEVNYKGSCFPDQPAAFKE